MRMDDWKICSYDNWYHQYYETTFESIIIPIPTNVVAYLREDGIVLPQEAIPQGTWKLASNNSNWEETEEDKHEIKLPSFLDFSQQLVDAMTHLGGSVFIKLNWSAPVDASWITADKTLRCTTLQDIYLLLKSSNKIAQDLSRKQKTFHSTTSFSIILKRWHEVHPGSEYRCFVFQNQLVAICQRDCTAHYEHISHTKFDVIESVTHFFNDNLKGNFPLADYVFDVMKKNGNGVYLIDLSPFDNIATKSLLFTWEELRGMGGNVTLPEFRFLAEEPGYQPKYYGIPLDAMAGSASLHNTSLMDHITLAIKEQSLSESNEHR